MFDIEQWRRFYFKGIYGFVQQAWKKKKFFVSRTPQQNGVFERKNMTVQEMAQTMLMDSKLEGIFWTHAMHTMVHI